MSSSPPGVPRCARPCPPPRSPNPLAWLLLFVALSIGATLANSRHLLDAPRDVASRAVAPLQVGVSRVAGDASRTSSRGGPR